jgi:hypothetical protein
MVVTQHAWNWPSELIHFSGDSSPKKSMSNKISSLLALNAVPELSESSLCHPSYDAVCYCDGFSINHNTIIGRSMYTMLYHKCLASNDCKSSMSLMR